MNYKTVNCREYVLDRLHDLMTVKKSYQDTECSMTSLAKRLGTPKRRLSELIRDNFDKSFPSYLNDFRLEEVLIRFENQDYKKHTIIAIALEAGFPSKSTFYRYFRKKMHTSPSEYLQSQQK